MGGFHNFFALFVTGKFGSWGQFWDTCGFLASMVENIRQKIARQLLAFLDHMAVNIFGR